MERGVAGVSFVVVCSRSFGSLLAEFIIHALLMQKHNVMQQKTIPVKLPCGSY